jgi:pimeloyl-ACP methyl ester carboxylesterase
MSPPLPTVERFSGDGLDLAAEIAGPPDGQPVLFFHGGGQSRRSWRGAAQRLAAAGYRTLNFDLRGHGDSGWDHNGDYLLDAYGRDVARLIDHFDRPLCLVGASRGGQAALVGASRRPGRVLLLMLADIAPLLIDNGIDRMRDFFQTSAGGFADVDAAADALAHQLELPRKRDASGLAKSLRRASDGRLYWHWDPLTVALPMIHPPSEGQGIELAASLVRCPVVMVRAEHSEIVSDAGVALFHHLTPQLEVIEAKGVGHMFTGDRNDAFAETLLEQLGRFAPVTA